MAERALFFQSLTVNEYEIGTHNVIEGTYIERLNLTGPKLILKLSDPDKLYQDTFKLKEGAALTLSLGDIDARGNALFQEKFTVGACYEKGNALVVEALQEDIALIKKRLSRPKFYVDKTPKDILSDIFPSHTLEIDDFNLRNTYHCLTNSTLALTLKQLSYDYGAAIWLQRGTVYMKNLDEIMDGKPILTFEHNQNGSEYSTIHTYQKYDTTSQQLRKTQRNYYSWDRTQGVKQLGNDYPRSYLPLVVEPQLKNHNLMPVHLLDNTLAGDGRFMPGLLIKMVLNRMTNEQLVDESVPSKQIIIGVRHYQHGQQFLSVCETGDIINAN